MLVLSLLALESMMRGLRIVLDSKPRVPDKVYEAPRSHMP